MIIHSLPLIKRVVILWAWCCHSEHLFWRWSESWGWSWERRELLKPWTTSGTYGTNL